MTDNSKKYILTAVAWPYSNNHLHLGHLVGAYLPADIFSRYHRMKGNHVLMVSGSDSHGTPVTVRAEEEGVTPKDIFERYHNSFLQTFDSLGIEFDLFTSTDTSNHADVTQDFFLRLKDEGVLYEAEQTLLFDPEVKRFLPDRYVEGTCPLCNSPNARGDQCDDCGSTLDALELIEPRSKLSESTPIRKESMHWFLKLSAFSERLTDWLQTKSEWKPQVRNLSLGMIGAELPDRSITRDLTWGIPVPIEGYDEKRIYVWFEAVIGYLSASIEWAASPANLENDRGSWKKWWMSSEAETYYFVGKDCIPFPAIIWPAMLMGYGGLNLPTNVPANQYLMMSGTKASKSRGTAIWAPDALEHLNPDALRYALTASMPETSDSDFTWQEFVRRNNDELVARWGNLVNRVLQITNRNFNGKIPERPDNFSHESSQLIELSEQAFDRCGQAYENVELRSGLQQAMEVATATNRYLEDRAPWSALKDETLGIAHAGETLVTALQVISNLAILLTPVLPFSSNQVLRLLGQSGTATAHGWEPAPIFSGTSLPQPTPLFEKLDQDEIEKLFNPTQDSSS